MFLKREVYINYPRAKVFRYIEDFSNIFEWDNNVVESHRLDLGPLKEGSRFVLKYSLMGRVQTLEYELCEKKDQQRLVFKCVTQSVSATDEISFEETSKGTKVSYQAKIELGSLVAESLFRPIMAKIADEVPKRLKAIFEGKVAEVRPDDYREEPLNLVNLPYRFTSPGWNHRRKTYTANEGRDKTILITGPTSGLGKSATMTLAGKGCDLVLVARNAARLKSICHEMRGRGFLGEIRTYLCDMENIEQVIDTCEKISRAGYQFDAIINNAGALFGKEKIIGDVERTTIVDLVSPWIFSKLLSMQLIEKQGCIVNVASGGMYSVPLDIEKLKKSPSPFSGSKAYAYAKRGMLVFSRGLDKELEKKGVRVHCMHPGWADTPGVLNSLPQFHRLAKRFLRSAFQGADTIVWLALENPKLGGQFWLDRKIQPFHLLMPDKEPNDDYGELRAFLETNSKN